MQKNINKAIEDFKNGKMIIIADDKNRENEGDVVIAAEKINLETMNFMIKKASGLVCLAVDSEIANRLKFDLMVKDNQESMKTAFTVSIDAKNGISTGISAADRVKTILTTVSSQATPEDLVRPGHIFPVIAKDNGLLERRGHTEASVTMAKLSGLKHAAVICEIIGDNGDMIRGKKLEEFANTHQLQLIHIDEIVRYIEDLEMFTDPIDLTTNYDVFKCFSVKEGHKEHLVLYKGEVKDKECLVRIHSECLTGDLFHSQHCDCGSQLNYSMNEIALNGGILLYLKQEGRDIGLFNKIKAYKLQSIGLDTVEANIELGLPIDNRKYDIAVKILEKLSPSKINLMTNNPKKLEALKSSLSINVERVAINSPKCKANINYLITKVNKMNHFSGDDHAI